MYGNITAIFIFQGCLKIVIFKIRMAHAAF